MRLNTFLVVISGGAIWRGTRDELIAIKRGWSRGRKTWQRHDVLENLLVKVGRGKVKPNVTCGAFGELPGLRA